MKINVDPISRLLKRIKKVDECWIWQGTLTSTGYGLFSYKGKPCMTHRASYALYKNGGELPKYHYGWLEKMVVVHSCNNKKCCNPEHLFLGNQKQNTRDYYEQAKASKSYKRPNSIITSEMAIDIRNSAHDFDGEIEMMKKYRINQAIVKNVYTGKTHKYL